MMKLLEKCGGPTVYPVVLVRGSDNSTSAAVGTAWTPLPSTGLILNPCLQNSEYKNGSSYGRVVAPHTWDHEHVYLNEPHLSRIAHGHQLTPRASEYDTI